MIEHIKAVESLFYAGWSTALPVLAPSRVDNFVDAVPKDELRTRAHVRFRSASACVKKLKSPILKNMIEDIKAVESLFDAGWSTALPVHAPSSVNNNCGYNLPQVFGLGNLWVIAQKLNPKLELIYH